MSFITPEQLHTIGFKSLGQNVLISDKTSIYNPGAISIGDHTRIDDFAILSAGAGGITIGRYVHIACFCTLIGQGAIAMEDFSGISSRVSIYSSNDDYHGHAMTNPTVPHEFTNVRSAPVTFRRHAIAGAGAVILPGVEMGEGAVLGALSLTAKDCAPYTIYGGVPARKIGDRERTLLDCERTFKAQFGIEFALALTA